MNPIIEIAQDTPFSLYNLVLSSNLTLLTEIKKSTYAPPKRAMG